MMAIWYSFALLQPLSEAEQLRDEYRKSLAAMRLRYERERDLLRATLEETKASLEREIRDLKRRYEMDPAEAAASDRIKAVQMDNERLR